YPTIFSMVMDILPIQASAVPCEWVFSSSKETTIAHWNCLSTEMMEALQILKFSAQQKWHLNFTQGTSKEAKLE
ncbi:hypothetical protein NEOLEDRAFT_1033018, partial [Neolentinus lepideus HHB14362 ss-1]